MNINRLGFCFVKNMKITISKGAFKILRTLKREGYEVYIVGGGVRDLLMNKSVYDWDFTTNAKPEEMLSILKDAYYTNKFGTVGVPGKSKKERPYEITTFRREHGYSDSRRPDKVTWGKTLEDDLCRRDFTINAMALGQAKTKSLKNRKAEKLEKPGSDLIQTSFDIIDLFQGQKDIEKKSIRAVGDPNERFWEDALRMMRAVRIASELGFEIEEKTFSAIKKNAKRLEKISRERIRDEFLKILSSNNPDKGILTLKETGILHYIIPEFEANFGVQQASPGRHHIYDVGVHSLMSLKFVSPRNNNPIVRFATLIHDIGKAFTFKKLPNGTITFYNHEVVGARLAKAIAERLRLSNNQKDKLWKLVRFHQFTLDERQTDSAVRRFIRNIGQENISDMLDLRVGDRLGGGARETSWRFEEFKERLIEVQKQPFSIRDLKISGTDVMEALNLDSGPKVGEILTKIYNDVVSKKLKNNKDELMAHLKKSFSPK